MPNAVPRVALFADTFHEANGVATICRELTRFARQRGLPFLCVRAGHRAGIQSDGALTTLELKRSALSFPVDYDLRFDPLLSRHKALVEKHVRLFRPDLIHITGPGDFGLLGWWVGHSLCIPRVASWHTNLHEYAGRRLQNTFSMLPSSWSRRISTAGENRALTELLRFYRRPHFLMAPNQTMVDLLTDRTRKPVFFMPHGVDLDRFSPALRSPAPRPFTIGYVGRLTPEKNVRLFVDLERQLTAAGRADVRLLLIGDGSERMWLARHLRNASLPGITRGEPLARAYADMDAFVFPSETDTFGLVLLEALASGVPVIAGPAAAARIDLRDGVEGMIAATNADFTRAVLHLMSNQSRRAEMSAAARQLAERHGWPQVFDQVYENYSAGLARL